MCETCERKCEETRARFLRLWKENMGQCRLLSFRIKVTGDRPLSITDAIEDMIDARTQQTLCTEHEIERSFREMRG